MKRLSWKKLVTKKTRQDHISKIISEILSWAFSLVFIALIIFILIASIPGFQAYGINNILFTSQFDLSTNQASIWMPLCVTILTSGIAIILAAPIGIKTSIFIKYRLPVRFQKPTRIAIELLANIPSVIFGLFASESLGFILQSIFHLETAYNLITAGMMLTFMILPTIVSLTMNALDSTDKTLLSASIALGNTKTRSIYKVAKKEVCSAITVAIIIALARAIGETMAVSMILQSQGYSDVFNSGFFAVITSGLRSLAVIISANMFAESGSAGLQGLLFAFGIFLFLFVMILNGMAMWLTKRKQRSKYQAWNKIERQIHNLVVFIPHKIAWLWEKITYHKKFSQRNISNYLIERTQKNKFLYFYTGWKFFWEYVCVLITGIFLVWIILNILGYGFSASISQTSSIFVFTKNSTGQAIINTLIIITIAIGIGLPLALMIAIYLNEFAKDSKAKKAIVFFIDSLGATPSILFGMFGLIFFIQTLGLSSGGSAGKSLIAGALTILIVILPTFIRTIQQALSGVSQEIRVNSYALGAGKWETIRKIVLPMAMQSITTAIILSIGRILAETAPLYLTSGLSSASVINLASPGQTLTTRIYAQIYNTNITEATSIMYECAFVTMILVLVIILIVYVLVPWWYRHRQERITKTKKPRLKRSIKQKFYDQINLVKNHSKVQSFIYNFLR